MFTSIFPGSSLLREMDLESFNRAPSLKQLLFKWGQGSEIIYSRLLTFTGSFLAAFFWIALIAPFVDRRWSRIRFFLFGCLLMGVCRYLICGRRIEDINVFIPVAILAGTAAFVVISRKLPPSRNLLKLVLLFLFLGLNLFPFFNQLRITPISELRIKNNLIHIRKQVAGGEVIISDLPWAVAWYAGRGSVWLPDRPSKVPDLMERFPMIKYLYMTPATKEYNRLGSKVTWPGIYLNRTRSPFWKAEEIISFPQEQFFSRITRK